MPAAADHNLPENVENRVSGLRTKPHFSILLATWFGLGYLPKAPGTWGSLGGVALALLANWMSVNYFARFRWSAGERFHSTSWLPAYAAIVFIAAIGVVASTRAAAFAQIKDPQWIVIDEVSGQLITYFVFSPVLLLNWKSGLLGFILFRLFDIWKPFPARQLENLPGGWGIMADDWMAGMYAAIVLQVALHFRVL